MLNYHSEIHASGSGRPHHLCSIYILPRDDDDDDDDGNDADDDHIPSLHDMVGWSAETIIKIKLQLTRC